MKILPLALAAIGLLIAGQAKADRSHPFIRIACVPENGLLDVDFRQLHDSVAGKRGAGGHKARRATPLSRAGYHRPNGLSYECKLDGARYQVAVEQAEASNFQCGAHPEIRLTLTRNGIRVLDDVVFGQSCLERPHVLNFTVGDGKKSWRGRIMTVCYSNGKDGGGQAPVCEWTSGPQEAFDKRFPVDDKLIERILTGPARP